LPAATQACQAAHAAVEFCLTYPRLTEHWHTSSGALVLLAARDELDLSRIRADLAAAGLIAVPFHEPDLDGALTAIAVEPAGRRFLARLPLVLATVAFSEGEEVTQ
jgi:Peptidyl-tRNA hydrolase PTH2